MHEQGSNGGINLFSPLWLPDWIPVLLYRIENKNNLKKSRENLQDKILLPNDIKNVNENKKLFRNKKSSKDVVSSVPREVSVFEKASKRNKEKISNEGLGVSDARMRCLGCDNFDIITCGMYSIQNMACGLSEICIFCTRQKICEKFNKINSLIWKFAFDPFDWISLKAVDTQGMRWVEAAGLVSACIFFRLYTTRNTHDACKNRVYKALLNICKFSLANPTRMCTRQDVYAPKNRYEHISPNTNESQKYISVENTCGKIVQVSAPDMTGGVDKMNIFKDNRLKKKSLALDYEGSSDAGKNRMDVVSEPIEVYTHEKNSNAGMIKPKKDDAVYMHSEAVNATRNYFKDNIYDYGTKDQLGLSLPKFGYECREFNEGSDNEYILNNKFYGGCCNTDNLYLSRWPADTLELNAFADLGICEWIVLREKPIPNKTKKTNEVYKLRDMQADELKQQLQQQQHQQQHQHEKTQQQEEDQGEYKSDFLGAALELSPIVSVLLGFRDFIVICEDYGIRDVGGKLVEYTAATVLVYAIGSRYICTYTSECENTPEAAWTTRCVCTPACAHTQQASNVSEILRNKLCAHLSIDKMYLSVLRCIACMMTSAVDIKNPKYMHAVGFLSKIHKHIYDINTRMHVYRKYSNELCRFSHHDINAFGLYFFSDIVQPDVKYACAFVLFWIYRELLACVSQNMWYICENTLMLIADTSRTFAFDFVWSHMRDTGYYTIPSFPGVSRGFPFDRMLSASQKQYIDNKYMTSDENNSDIFAYGAEKACIGDGGCVLQGACTGGGIVNILDGSLWPSVLCRKNIWGVFLPFLLCGKTIPIDFGVNKDKRINDLQLESSEGTSGFGFRDGCFPFGIASWGLDNETSLKSKSVGKFNRCRHLQRKCNEEVALGKYAEEMRACAAYDDCRLVFGVGFGEVCKNHLDVEKISLYQCMQKCTQRGVYPLLINAAKNLHLVCIGSKPKVDGLLSLPHACTKEDISTTMYSYQDYFSECTRPTGKMEIFGTGAEDESEVRQLYVHPRKESTRMIGKTPTSMYTRNFAACCGQPVKKGKHNKYCYSRMRSHSRDRSRSSSSNSSWSSSSTRKGSICLSALLEECASILPDAGAAAGDMRHVIDQLGAQLANSKAVYGALLQQQQQEQLQQQPGIWPSMQMACVHTHDQSSKPLKTAAVCRHSRASLGPWKTPSAAAVQDSTDAADASVTVYRRAAAHVTHSKSKEIQLGNMKTSSIYFPHARVLNKTQNPIVYSDTPCTNECITQTRPPSYCSSSRNSNRSSRNSNSSSSGSSSGNSCSSSSSGRRIQTVGNESNGGGTGKQRNDSEDDRDVLHANINAHEKFTNKHQKNKNLSNVGTSVDDITRNAHYADRNECNTSIYAHRTYPYTHPTVINPKTQSSKVLESRSDRHTHSQGRASHGNDSRRRKSSNSSSNSSNSNKNSYANSSNISNKNKNISSSRSEHAYKKMLNKGRWSCDVNMHKTNDVYTAKVHAKNATCGSDNGRKLASNRDYYPHPVPKNNDNLNVLPFSAAALPSAASVTASSVAGTSQYDTCSRTSIYAIRYRKGDAHKSDSCDNNDADSLGAHTPKQDESGLSPLLKRLSIQNIQDACYSSSNSSRDSSTEHYSSSSSRDSNTEHYSSRNRCGHTLNSRTFTSGFHNRVRRRHTLRLHRRQVSSLKSIEASPTSLPNCQSQIAESQKSTPAGQPASQTSISFRQGSLPASQTSLTTSQAPFRSYKKSLTTSQTSLIARQKGIPTCRKPTPNRQRSIVNTQRLPQASERSGSACLGSGVASRKSVPLNRRSPPSSEKLLPASRLSPRTSQKLVQSGQSPRTSSSHQVRSPIRKHIYAVSSGKCLNDAQKAGYANSVSGRACIQPKKGKSATQISKYKCIDNTNAIGVHTRKAGASQSEQLTSIRNAQSQEERGVNTPEIVSQTKTGSMNQRIRNDMCEKKNNILRSKKQNIGLVACDEVCVFGVNTLCGISENKQLGGVLNSGIFNRQIRSRNTDKNCKTNYAAEKGVACGQPTSSQNIHTKKSQSSQRAPTILNPKPQLVQSKICEYVKKGMTQTRLCKFMQNCNHPSCTDTENSSSSLATNKNSISLRNNISNSQRSIRNRQRSISNSERSIFNNNGNSNNSCQDNSGYSSSRLCRPRVCTHYQQRSSSLQSKAKIRKLNSPTIL